MDQDIRFCKTADGVRIAYVITGSGPPLVRSLGWFTHLEHEWETPYWRPIVEELSRHFTMIRYDGRGMGLSDREVTDFSLDAKVGDLEAVVNAVGADSYHIWGISEGGPTAVTFTARHPERVRRLVLYGSTPNFARNADEPQAKETFETMLSLVRQGWGSDNPMFRQFFTGMFVPDATGDAARLFTDFQRASAPPENVTAMLQALSRYNVLDIAPRVTVPTLVIHRRGDVAVPFDAGREFAALIPGARFLPMDGRNHIPMPDEPVATKLLEALTKFLYEGEAEVSPAKSDADTQTGLVTILFTDLVRHTEMMYRLGDERGRDILREHERITRETLKAHGGTEVKTMGDGFMASFRSVLKAVECAVALQRAFAERNTSSGEPINVRVGLNAGEPIQEEGDLFGSTVIMAARVAAKADGGEILASDVVRGLCSGKGFLFADRGDHVMKGFEEPARIHEINWRS